MAKLILRRHGLWLLFGLSSLLGVPARTVAAPAGSTAPTWSLVDAQGAQLNSTNFAGQVVVLNFFATWCIPCVWEVPDFVALQEQYRQDGLVIVGVAVNQEAAELLPFMAANNVNYPMCPSSGSILWDFEVLPSGAIPVTAIIDRNNILVASYPYYHTKAFYEDALRPLLFPAAAPTLALQRSGANMLISWPDSGTNFVVQTRSNCSPGVAWTTLTNASITVSSGVSLVAVPMSGHSGFFRLKAP